MKTFKNPPRTQWAELLSRPRQTKETVDTTVSGIFEDVRQNGDTAISRYTTIFDGVEVKDPRVTAGEIQAASQALPPSLKAAIKQAKAAIEQFHLAQRSEVVKVYTAEGVCCWQEKRPIQKVGLYIPGGTAPLFSTVLMLAVPAQLAGCQEIVLVSPPDRLGKIHPAILYAAGLCGVTTVLAMGGIQAIAGLTFGTSSCPQVYKIFGPGNQFVTAAKQLATRYGVAIDMPAGPSELLVLTDQTARPDFIAADLLSQAEHGADSQVILLSTAAGISEAVAQEISSQLQVLPRKEIAAKALENSKSIQVKDKETALELVNVYGPEHLILCTDDNDFYKEGLINAGSVFIGNYSPESAGDYASGTNHTLPTNGYSKAYSGVNLDAFLKAISFQEISEEGILNIGPAIETMAEAEGLQAHKNAVSIRLKNLQTD